jgi:hypothetical protein
MTHAPNISDINTRKLFLTIFKDEKASVLFHGEYTLPGWRDRILESNAAAKADLFWLKGARFGNIKSKKKSYRTNLNVLSITAVVVEHDAGTISFDEARVVLVKAGVRALIYTSPSHATDKQRWRVVLPLSKDEAKTRHDILVAIVNGLFGGALSPESFVLAQSYYFGAVNHNPEHRCEIVDGTFLDLDDRLYAGSIFSDGSRVGDNSPLVRVRNAANEDGERGAPNQFSRAGHGPPDDPAKVAFALDQISSDIPYYGNPGWMTIGAALASEVDYDEGFKIFDAWSKTSARYDATQIVERWDAFCEMSFIGIGSLYHFADEANPGWRKEWKAQADGGNSQEQAGPDADWTHAKQYDGWLDKGVDALPEGISARCKVMIAHVGTIDNLNTDLKRAIGGKRHETLATLDEIVVALAVELLAVDLPVEKVAAALLCDLKCNAPITKLPNEVQRRNAADRAIYAARAKITASKESEAKPDNPGVGHDDLARMNAVYAVLPIGGKTRVVTFGVLEEFPSRKTIVMTQSIGDFTALQNKYRHQYLDKKGELQSVPMGAYWINSQHRRQYDGGLAFMPQHTDGLVGNKLNLWRGYGVNAIKPLGKSGAAGCKLFLDFMRDVICNRNEEHFEYLTKREATILQKRIRSEIALGLRSDDEGVGKGFYETVMGHLLGEHAMQVGNPKHVIGAFNPHLESLLRLTADEALFVGNPEHRNSLFGLITEPKLTIEPKGCGVYRADSFLNLSVTSNAKHFLPISGTARRFFIPTISPEHIQDHAYFKAIKDQLNDGGYEALLYYFLNEVDLKDFNVRLVPKTEGLMEQRNHSLLPLEAWWVELLESGTIAGADPNAPNRAVSNEYQRQVESDLFNGTTQSRFVRQLGIFDQARLIEPRLKHHFSDHRLGTYLSEMGCDNHKRVLRRRGWTFPDLMACRSGWERRFPGWPWRNATMTEWRPEEDVDPEAETEMTCEDKMNAAAKAQAHADRLFKEVEVAQDRAKYRS